LSRLPYLAARESTEKFIRQSMSLLRHILPAALLCAALAPTAVAQHIAPPPAARLVIADDGAAISSKSAPALLSAPTQEYSHGDPTAQEQLLLEMINRARANPLEEGARLVMTKDPDVWGAYNYFQIDTALVRAQFAGYPSRPPLAFNAKLIAAARRHTADMLLNDFQGHQGTDGSTFDQRIREAGYTSYTALGENVGAYAQSIWYGHVGFNVDWGNPQLGHRHNIMNFDATDQIYTEFGAGIHVMATDPPQGKVGPVIVTEEFARNSDGPFLLGVVYNDANSNGFYDVGEGLSGVRVTPSSGTYYAVTSTSGGYAIPVKTAGTSFTVTFSQGPLVSTYARSVTITAGQNLKLDLAPTSAPGAVTIVRPAAGGIATTDTVRFTWRRPSPTVTKYHLMVATDSLMTALVINDSTITDTTSVRRGLVNGTRYFVQVRAYNSAGWGELATAQSFRVVLLPTAPSQILPTTDGQVLRENVRFMWSRPAGPVTGYTFELANDPGMTSIVVRDTAVTDTTYLVASIESDRYYWRVRAKNEAGWGPYSPVRQLQGTTAGVDGAESDAAIDRLEIASIWPNPVAPGARGSASVRLPQETRVRIEIVDALGAVIDDVTPEHAAYAAGEYVVPFSSGDLTQGLYFLRIVTESGATASAPLKIVAPVR
jgi:hypothetical protein